MAGAQGEAGWRLKEMKKKASPNKKASHENTRANNKTKTISEKVALAKRSTHSHQAHRLVDYLLENGPSSTTQIASNCAIGNISHAASLIRPALKKQGIYILAELPRPLVKNRFGERSNSHIWRLMSS